MYSNVIYNSRFIVGCFGTLGSFGSGIIIGRGFGSSGSIGSSFVSSNKVLVDLVAGAFLGRRPEFGDHGVGVVGAVLRMNL